jgi:hypothetical protein
VNLGQICGVLVYIKPGWSVLVWTVFVVLLLWVLRINLRHNFLSHRNPVGDRSFYAGTWTIELCQLMRSQDRCGDQQNAFAALIYSGSIAYGIRFVFAMC